MINLFFVMIIFFGFENESNVIKLQEKFKSIKTIIADFSQSTGSESKLNGKFYFKKENNYRIELKNNIIISDGESIWNHDLKRKKVIISNIEEDPLSFSLSDYIYNYPSKCEVTEENLSGGVLLLLDAGKSDLNFKNAKLWINNDFVINKIEVMDFSGNSFTLQFRNIEIDKTIASDKFIFIDNGDNKIIDLR